MNGIVANVLLVLLFVVIGAVFVASEIALVSLREGQVKTLAQRGRRGERVAALHANPNRFLAAVQIGVTLAGFFSAAFGAATLADDLTPVVERWGVPARFAGTISLVLITLVISYLSLVLGELVPKRIALQRAETVSLAVAPTLDRLAKIAQPVIWLLSRSTDLVVRLLGSDPEAQREQISEEELREIVAGHETLGGEERRLIEEVFAAGERQLHEVMVPRTEVDFLDVSTPVFKAVRLVADKPHSRYPVVRGSHDDVVGFVHVRDLFAPEVSGRSVRVGEIVRDVAMMPGTKQVLPALSEMRRSGQHLAIVLDEYGGTDGIVTLEDLVEELVGDIRDEYDVAAEQAGDAGDEQEADGLLNLSDFAERTGIELPEGPYETVAGFLMHQLGRVPELGDSVETLGHCFTVTELDGRRVARVRLAPLPEGSAADSTAPDTTALDASEIAAAGATRLAAGATQLAAADESAAAPRDRSAARDAAGDRG
ncbi:MAG: hemolysin family protein [Actinomycetota bacterium]|nr:hemolysin family protein [Actinomycetota bacterium]